MVHSSIRSASRHNILFREMGQLVLPDQAVWGIAEQLTLFLRARNPQNLNDVYVGHVTLPSGQRRSRAFVKVFPPQDRNQLVYNEIIGHYLALQCGLPHHSRSPARATGRSCVAGHCRSWRPTRGPSTSWESHPLMAMRKHCSRLAGRLQQFGPM